MSGPRVLVIRGGAIGDFILTLPVMELLREHIPGVHVEVLGYDSITALAKASGLADATRHLEHHSMARLFVPNAPLGAELETYFKSFTLILSYLYDPDDILKNNFESLGVKTYLAGNPKLSSEPGSPSAAFQLAKPLEKIAFFLEKPYVELRFPPTESAPPRPQILMHPGSGSVHKNLPPLKWVELGKKLSKAFPDHEFITILGEAERERGLSEHLRMAWQHTSIQFWEDLSLVELAKRMTLAKAFIGHDSGIAHLAAACGLPGLQFFGPTSPEVWAPKNPRFSTIQSPTGNLTEFDSERAFHAMNEFIRSV